jgi:hypothetical protein
MMSLVLVIHPQLLEIVWISLNHFDTWYYLCDIILGTARIRDTQDKQSNSPTGIVTFIWDFFFGSIVSSKNVVFSMKISPVKRNLLTARCSLLTGHREIGSPS